MTNFDIPNESELNPYKVYDYDLVATQYPIDDNTSHGTYDQFLWLRDTLVKSGKKYSGKGGSKLIIGEEESTVEIIWKNRWKLSFEPNWKEDPANAISLEAEGPYVSYDPTVYFDPAFGYLSCKILKNGRYRIAHKEEIVNMPATVTQIYAYVNYYPIGDNGLLPENGIPIAVFDWMADVNKTFSVTGGQGGGSVNVKLTIGEIFQKVTAFGYNERDMRKGDIIVLKVVDQDGNDLPLQNYSNFLSVEYIDLSLK